jgi:DNA helicase-2/ATP-dependent DNA helicase PcrA
MLAAISPPAAAAGDWPALAGLLGTLLGRRAPWPGTFEAVRSWYAPHLERRHDDAPARQADLAQLGQIAAQARDCGAFLTDLALDPPEAASDEAGPPLLDEDYLILSTIHSAKGQEWRAVYLLNLVDGCIPSDMATSTPEEIEEERRLLYVAMTRARDELHLVVPQRFFTHQQARLGDRHVYASRSRFVPPGLLGHFEVSAWSPPAAASDRMPAGLAEPVDIGARMRQMWR